MTAVGQYIRNVAFALDRVGNAVLGGDPDWTISQRMGQAISEDRCTGCYWICRALALIDHRHCERVYDPAKSHTERLWPASVAFAVGMAALALLAVMLSGCAGPWSLWTQTGPPKIERKDREQAGPVRETGCRSRSGLSARLIRARPVLRSSLCAPCRRKWGRASIRGLAPCS